MDDVVLLSNLYSYKTRVHILMKDIDVAEEIFKTVDNIKAEISLPYFLADLLLSQFIIDVYRLELEINRDKKARLTKLNKIARKSGRKAISITRKVAGNRTEAIRLMGTYLWLLGKHEKALKWWSQSIAVGESLGARVELARTYMEIGKRFLEEKSKYKELNGISAQEYLNKAGAMFQEMDLQWDLDELKKLS